MPLVAKNAIQLASIVALSLATSAPLRAQEGGEVFGLDQVLRPRGMGSRGPAGLRWHPDGERITWFAVHAGQPSLLAQKVAGGEVEVLITRSGFIEAWNQSELEPAARSLSQAMTWNPDGSLRLRQGRKLLRIELDPLRIQQLLELPSGSSAVAFAPGDQLVACVRKHNIAVVKSDGSTVSVTSGGGEDRTHGVAVSRSEFGIHDGMWWDPGGRYLAFYREDLSPIDAYPYVDFRPTPAKPVHGRYPMAGRKGSVVSVGVYDSRGDAVVWLETDPGADEYLSNVTWNTTGDGLFVAHVNRGQNLMELKEYDPATGKLRRSLFSEADAQWIEPEAGPVFLPDGSGSFLWFSPRDGFRHLYHYAADGSLVRKVTDGSFDVSAFVGWDRGGKAFFFNTTGPDPRHEHLYRSTLEGEQRAVTGGRGVHQTRVAPDGRHALDTHESLEHPSAIDLLECSSGKVVRRIHAGPDPLQRYRLGEVRMLELELEDGQMLYAQLILPPDFDPARRYPAIQYVYGGPHSQLVKDRWRGGLGRWTLWLHHMAVRGCVILIADNRGTSKRGAEWEQAIHRRLGTLEVADQVRVLDHVVAQGLVDPERIGVTGWSYGGFMTLSLMTRAGGRYRVGIAGAPVADWAYYETGYGERYMDTPKENPKGYKNARPASHLKGLEGRLIVVQGSADKTVMWQNSIAFADACIQAGKEVEMMVYPGELHGLRGRAFAHFLRKSTAAFVDELLTEGQGQPPTVKLFPRVEKVAGGFRFTEGPAWSPDGFLYFSDIPEARIHRVRVDGELELFLGASGGANGLAFDAAGNLYVCEGKGRRVVRIDPAGRKDVLAENYEGQRLNSPNDLALDDHGGLYFTDPRYGSQEGREMEVMGVYYISARGELRRILDDLVRPNGILVSADGKQLFVADADRGLLLAYPIRRPGVLGKARVHYTGDSEIDGRGPDGMALDIAGNLYLAYRSIVVLRPDGRLTGRIEIPEAPTNCIFGGPDGRWLYVTARTGLYRVPMTVQGLPARGARW